MLVGAAKWVDHPPPMDRRAPAARVGGQFALLRTCRYDVSVLLPNIHPRYDRASTAWGSDHIGCRGRDLLDTVAGTGLLIINTGCATFVRRGVKSSAIDPSLVSDQSRYEWKREADAWGSDNYRLHLEPLDRSRTDWPRFRQLSAACPPSGVAYFSHVARCVEAASRKCTVPVGTPVPDIKLLNLRAARRRLQRRATKSDREELWTLYNRLDAVFRRHARRAHWTTRDAPRQLAELLADTLRLSAPESLPEVRREWYKPRCFFLTAGVRNQEVSLSQEKTEAMLLHPSYGAQRYTPKFTLQTIPIPWKRRVTYLGVQLDQRLNWTPAVSDQLRNVPRVASAARALLARGSGCTASLALRIYNGMAAARILYGFPLAALTRSNWETLDTAHRVAIRQVFSLPRSSQIGPTLAEAGDMPLSLRADLRALNHIERMKRSRHGQQLVSGSPHFRTHGWGHALWHSTPSSRALRI
ncbi:hypothetical protein HPB51_019327 [Rhipicephalus microplus]|uniref:Tick transposon n=1 Tax=Rhipicephalus microplus TaxID=6941 RepID=A0A9J6DBQ0_RHIMP|nr:hypothetical protein HPB51_019327 [Rhipicephalus microplus]